jgi:hypothetical protein
MYFYLMLLVAQWWASRPDRFKPEESALGYFGQMAGWSTEPIWSMHKSLCSSQKLNLGHTVFQFSAQSLCRLAIQINTNYKGETYIFRFKGRAVAGYSQGSSSAVLFRFTGIIVCCGSYGGSFWGSLNFPHYGAGQTFRPDINALPRHVRICWFQSWDRTRLLHKPMNLGGVCLNL